MAHRSNPSPTRFAETKPRSGGERSGSSVACAPASEAGPPSAAPAGLGRDRPRSVVGPGRGRRGRFVHHPAQRPSTAHGLQEPHALRSNGGVESSRGPLTDNRSPEPVRPAAVAATPRRPAPASERLGRGDGESRGRGWVSRGRDDSGGVAATLGYEDHEAAPAGEMLAAAARIARGVEVPVSVDAEAGYGMEPAELVTALRGAGA